MCGLFSLSGWPARNAFRAGFLFCGVHKKERPSWKAAPADNEHKNEDNAEERI